MKKSIRPSPLSKRQLSLMGANIKMARLRRQLSLRDVAARAGLSVNTVLGLEKGEPGIGIGAIANVLHALGLSDDIGKIGKDDLLGRKLQDLQIEPKKRAPKKHKSKEAETT
jgi:transcriptional regulator with XRE-family HTH domain